MSPVSVRLGQRTIEPHSGEVAGTRTTLAQLRRGQTGVIHDIAGDVDPATARRMVDLGFAPGTEVQLLRRAPMADPVMYRIAGYDMALRREQARAIVVTVVP